MRCLCEVSFKRRAGFYSPTVPVDKVSNFNLFLVIGMDFAGLELLKASSTLKIFRVVFNCAIVRAVNLELLSDTCQRYDMNFFYRFFVVLFHVVVCQASFILIMLSRLRQPVANLSCRKDLYVVSRDRTFVHLAMSRGSSLLRKLQGKESFAND